MSEALQFCHHKEGVSSAVRQLADVYWNWRLKIRPEFATLTGCHVYDDQLDCHTLETYDGMKKQGEEFLRQLNCHDESDMDAEDWTNYVILKEELNMFLSGIKFKGYLLCLNSPEDGRFYFARVINRMKFENEGDYNKLLSRYEKFPEQMNCFIQLFKQGIKEGMTHHVNCVKGMAESNEKFSLLDPKDTAFYTPFEKLAELTNIPKDRKEEIKSQGIHLIVNNIQESVKTLVVFLKKEYFNHLRTNMGSSALPNGKAFYEESLKFHITCDLSAEEVHNIGFREVKRIKENMHRVMKQVGFQGDIKSFFEYLRNEKRFYFKTKNELLEGYEKIVKQVKQVLPKYFKCMPNVEMRIVEISTNAEHLSAAFYFGPSADGSKPGVFNVNCHNFQARPMFEMMSLCLHEAEPGHHLQSSYSVLMDYLPGFRRFKDDRFYGIVPSRFPMHTGYIEGWGMYSEFLGEEMGLYDDPYTLFGRYCSEIFRACRLVVDTGLHVYGWSFEKAVQFIEENTAMSREVIEIEVRRYLTLPGQGCAYTIGELKIRELRKKCEDEFGDKFDLREFHDAVLSCGPVPLTVL